MKTGTRGMTIAVAVLAVLAVAGMAWVAFCTLGGPNEEALQTDALSLLAQQGQLTLGGQPLPAAQQSGTVTAGGSEIAFSQAGEAPADPLAFQAVAALAFATPPVSSAVQVTDETGAVVFTGDAEAFNRAFAPASGQYTIEVVADFALSLAVQEQSCPVSASVCYRAPLRFDIPVSFHLSAETVSQGDVLLFCADGLRDPAGLTVELPFSYTPVFEQTPAGCYAYIPFNYMRGEGEYTVKAGYNGEEMEFTYQVTEPDYEVQHLTVSQTTASATIGNNTAVADYNAAMDRLGAVYDSEIYWTEDFIQPVSGSITTEFGIKRYTNNAATPTRHAGIDIAAAEGTPVAASNSGRVIFAGYLQVSGYTVVIEHGMGLHTMYLHMSELACAEGDMVARGDVIGRVGQTGFATGPHLHFQAQVGSMCISPWYLFDGSSGVYDIREKR